MPRLPRCWEPEPVSAKVGDKIILRGAGQAPCSVLLHRKGSDAMKRTDKGVISWKQKIFPYVLIAPNTIIFVVFIIVPAICGIYYSMTEWKGIGEPVFIGLANYAQAFTDAKFWTAIWHNCVYAVITLPLIIVIPLLLANLLIQKLPGKGFFRAIIYWPSMISYIVTGVAFKFIFGDASGIINYILSHFGMEKIEWMTQGTTAMAVVIIATVWSCSGYYMVMFMAGLQSIPVSYYEAAEVDGASAFQRFMRITVPLIRPTMFLVLILGLLNLFKAYGMVISLPGGGPAGATKFAVQFIYERAFSEFDMGYACALSIILMVLLGVFTCIQFKLNKGGSVND